MRRSKYFLISLVALFFNPVILFWYGTSRTFIVVIPVTLLVWFAVKWGEFANLEAKSSRLEILIGTILLLGNLGRNAVAHSGFGIFDMLVSVVALIIIFFGLRPLRRDFLLPITYLAVLVVGYWLEFRIPEIHSLQNFLAQTIVSGLSLLGIKANTWASNPDIVTVWGRAGIPDPNPFSLWIERDCTGLKGVLAYGSLAVLMVLDLKATVWKKLAISIVGLAGTFVVNIGRLLVIFLSAYQWGVDAGLEVHAYLGYALFIGWVLVYWSLALRYAVGPTTNSSLPLELR